MGPKRENRPDGQFMSYVFLLGAIVSEIFASTFLRLSKGFEESFHTFLSVALFSLSIFFLSKAVKEIPLSVAYCLWAGLGITGNLLAGYLVFQETITPQQTWGSILIIGGAILVRTWQG